MEEGGGARLLRLRAALCGDSLALRKLRFLCIERRAQQLQLRGGFPELPPQLTHGLRAHEAKKGISEDTTRKTRPF